MTNIAAATNACAAIPHSCRTGKFATFPVSIRCAVAPDFPSSLKRGPRQGGYLEETQFRLRHGRARAAGFGSPAALAATIKPYSWDLNPPTDTRDNFIAWGKARGEDPVFLGQRWDRFQALLRNKDIWGAGHHPRLPADAARGVRLGQPGDPQARLRARLPRHRLRRHHVRPASAGPHDQRDRRQARREGARDRHRLGRASRPIIANLTENAYTIEIIAPLAARTRALYDKLIDEGLHRVQAHQDQGRRRLLRLGRGGALRQDHRHLRHRPRAAAAAAAAQDRRPDGDPGRPAGRAARAQGHQDARAPTARSRRRREDIYGGKIVPFVPFTKLEGDKIVGTHNR